MYLTRIQASISMNVFIVMSYTIFYQRIRFIQSMPRGG